MGVVGKKEEKAGARQTSGKGEEQGNWQCLITKFNMLSGQQLYIQFVWGMMEFLRKTVNFFIFVVLLDNSLSVSFTAMSPYIAKHNEPLHTQYLELVWYDTAIPLAVICTN